MKTQISADIQIKQIVTNLDVNLEKLREQIQKEKMASKKMNIQGEALGRLSKMLLLYCQPSSRYYHDVALIPELIELADGLLKTQLPSGNISLQNCNIDSPPDTSFTSHYVASLYQVALNHGGNHINEVTDRICLFLKRCADALLVGGIHTPNHRWVMASALAKMEELFGGDKYRERAFEFLNEGLDITEYGEWTERSNAIYNAICAYYLYTVGKVFNYQPAMEAAKSTLLMMRYLLHPGNTIVTEYSGRQDLGQIAHMDDRYYVSYHLLASYYQDADLASMAYIAIETAPKAETALMHWMLEPEAMMLPEIASEPLTNYTILFGEHNKVPVPNKVPYIGPLVKHPHGAAVLRHRRDKLSITVMAGQPESIYMQYGDARMIAMKLGIGWFGIGAAAFSSISKISEDQYRMEIDLEGCYFGPLTVEQTRDTNGSYVNMPNHLRAKTSIVTMSAAIEIKLLEDGMDVRVISNDREGIFIQAVCIFDEAVHIEGDGLERTGKLTQRLNEGSAVFRKGNDVIYIEGGAYEHVETLMRNDTLYRDAQHIMINWTTPLDSIVKFRGFTV